jgi:hypothetical protein
MAITADGLATAELEIVVLPGFEVDSFVDATDANDGIDSICATAANECTLRAAIQTTNRLATKQLVLLKSAGTYTLDLQLQPIGNDVVIFGQGARTTKIVASTVHAYAALQLSTANSLALRDLAIESFGGDNGGALRVTAGSLDVDRCNFTDNQSPGSGGVLFINGGAQARLSRCTFTGNASLGGNGGGWGGVIDGEDDNTAIVVTQSTAIGNTTEWGSFSHITTGTTLRLENSTLYGNVSTTAGTLATPGGIYTLVNVTMVGNSNTNSTPDSAGLYLYSAPCHYTVSNSLIAFNTDITGAQHNCNRRDLGTSLTSGGGNIFSDSADNCAMYFDAGGDRLSSDPKVVAGAPSDHGGMTATIVLAPGSPALDSGAPADCPAVDQRGMPRPAGACDVGAVEMP